MAFKEQLLQQFYEQRAINLEITALEASGQKWGVYGRGIASYERSFNSTLIPSLRQFVLERSQFSRGCVALDLMGPGQVLRELTESGLQSGIAQTLADIRTPEQVKWDNEHGITLVAGDLLVGSTWKGIKEALLEKRKTFPYFDMIVCRPIDGLKFITERVDMHFSLLNRAYLLLNPNGGGLLTQMTDGDLMEISFTGWVELLNQIRGLRAEITKPDFKDPKAIKIPSLTIIRSKGSPVKLPANP